MMCCDFKEPLGEMYRRPTSELKVILTRAAGGHTQSRIDEPAARQALKDRLELQELWDKAVVLWYRERKYLGHTPKQYGGDWK